MHSGNEEHAMDYLKSKVCKYWTKFDGYIFLCAFAMAVLVHLFMFTHKFINHDDVDGLYSSCAFGLASGRWLLETITGLTGNFSSSWLNGLAGSIYLALSSVLTVRLFRIRHYLPALLMSLCLVAFPVIASTYSYMFCAPQYLFAMAAAVVGAYCIRQEKFHTMAIGSIAIAFSMGCYQAYFSLAAVLLVAALALDMLDGRFEASWKKFLITAIKYIGFLALGIVLYFIILKLCLWITNTELTAYQGIDSMAQLTIPILFERIYMAYGSFVNFCMNRSGIFGGVFSLVVLLDICLIFAVIIGRVVSQKLYRSVLSLVFLAALILVFPLASCLVYIMTAPDQVHFVMVYPLVILLILPAVVLDRLKLRSAGNTIKDYLLRKGSIVLMAALLLVQSYFGYECVLVSNRAYFNMYMTYENAYAFYTKLTTKIESYEGYAADSPVALIGWANMPTTVPDSGMTGVLTGNSALNIYSLAHFLTHYLATSYHYVSPETKEEIMATDKFANMPCYPAEDSIGIINGVIVVKFS